jgi:hypothetical protein
MCLQFAESPAESIADDARGVRDDGGKKRDDCDDVAGTGFHQRHLLRRRIERGDAKSIAISQGTTGSIAQSL